MGRPRKWDSDAARMRATRGGQAGEAENSYGADREMPAPGSPDLPAGAPALVAGDAELELGPGGEVLVSRFGRLEDYVARARAGAFSSGDGETADDVRGRAERYARWRWDAFHRGQVAGL